MGEGSSEKINNFRKNRKKILVDISGNKCNICGYNKTLSALEFHHINPQDKIYGLSTGNCHNLKSDLQELQKCILVCANCHREIHDGFYSVQELLKYKIYDKNKELFFLEDNLKKQHREKKYCKNCGKELYRDTQGEYCINCIGLTKRKVERPNREELKQLIRNNSFVQVGKMFGVSDNAVRKWCILEHLPSKKSEINTYSQEEWIKV